MIPKELTYYPQWVYVRQKDKAPLQADGQLAEINNPDTWHEYTDFNDDVHIRGFVLTDNDPYTIIDLDDPLKDKNKKRTKKEIGEIRKEHGRIINEFRSYTELSLSQKGAHIIVKGALPNNFKKDTIEAYSTKRYFALTGNTIKYTKIKKCQKQLDALYKKYGKKKKEKFTQKQNIKKTNKEIISELSIIEKFQTLFFAGDFSDYPSQSEADQALCQLISLKTKNREQIKRIFLKSALGKRKKAHRPDYLDRCLEYVDFSSTEIDTSSILINPAKYSEKKSTKNNQLNFPNNGGLVDRIANYIFETSYVPTKEASLCAAIGFCAGLYGRSFRVSKDKNLNLFLILLAKTGMGKGALLSGMQRILKGIRNEQRFIAPIETQLLLSPYIASGQGLFKDVAEQPCKAYVFGEFADDLRRWQKSSNSTDILLRKLLLSLFDNEDISGALFADRAKNLGRIYSPCVSLIGETVPFKYFELLTPHTIDEGFGSRFMHFIYNGERSIEENPNHGNLPDKKLIADILDTFEYCLMRSNAQKAAKEILLSKQAKDLFSELNIKAIKENNKADERAPNSALWNRAHLKALKLAALVSLGHKTFIDEECAQWAINIVTKDIESVLTILDQDVYGVSANAERKTLERLFIKLAKTVNGVTYVKKRDLNKYARRTRAFCSSFSNKESFNTRIFDSEISALVSEGFCSIMTKDDYKKISKRARGIGYRLRLKKGK